MPAPRSTDPTPSAEPHQRLPVFVDRSGRRARWLVFLGRVAVAVCLVYVGLVTASLVGAPWVPHEVLPSVGPSPRAKTPVTLPPTAARQAAPTVPARRTTTTVRATGSSTTVRRAGSSTTSTTASRGRTTTTAVVPGTTTTTTTTPGRSGSAPGRTTHA